MIQRSYKGIALFLLSGLIVLSSGQARATTFTNGEFVTNTQADWREDATANAILTNHFQSVYFSEGVTLTVGTGFSMLFESASDVLAYLPTSGTAATLDHTILNPTSTSSGVFGGNVTALALDVDFSAAGWLGTSTTPYGSLVLTSFTGSYAVFDGMSISQFLALAEFVLGGGSTTYNLDDVNSLTGLLSGAFESGVPFTSTTDDLAFPDTNVAATPLPGALPLFAGGLGALGLLGWCRKRKNAAALAGT